MPAEQLGLTRPFDGGYSDGDEMARVQQGFQLLPSTNGDGVPIVPMSAADKYVFDLQGWILYPGLLSEEQLAPIREHQLKFRYEPESLPPEHRDYHGGPSQLLLDHPVIAGVLNEVLSNQGLADEDTYGYRFDHTGLQHRVAAKEVEGQVPGIWSPHGGGGYFNFRQNSHIYQMEKGRCHSGLTRVVWELNPVTKASGGTRLLTGSHKSAFVRPPELSTLDNPIFDTYECPAGSCLIFSEALCHSGIRWTDPVDRLALFTCFDTVNAKWGTERTPPEVVMAMPPKRRTLFRAVNAVNKEYDPAFPASQFGDGGEGAFGDLPAVEKLREEVEQLKAKLAETLAKL